MFSLINQILSGDQTAAIISILARCLVVFCCLPVHEFAHAFVAYKLGDNTAKVQGRLTLNPFAHLSPVGTIMIFLFGIGFAKPVPVNIGRFKNKKGGMALVALAGPVSNIIMAFISIFCFYAVAKFFPLIGSVVVAQYIALFFSYAASINISLAVFNLIPIPPLDGSRVLNAALPSKTYYKIMQYERYIMIALIAVLFFGVLDKPIAFLSQRLFEFLSILPKLIFGV